MANLGSILNLALKARADKVSLEKVKPVPIVMPTMTVPKGFKEIRKIIINYFANPAAYIDMDSIHIDGEDGNFRIASLESVLDVEKLGQGAYGAAYRVGDKALKIIHSKDNSYAAFIRFIRETGHKYSCFPKVYYSGTWGKKTVYIIELMEKTSDDNEYERQFIANLARNIMLNWNEKSRRPCRFFSLPSDFYEGMEALRKFYQANRLDMGLCEDLHNGNVMIRPNGEPVITDPFS